MNTMGLFWLLMVYFFKHTPNQAPDTADALQTPQRHPPGTLQTPSRHPLELSVESKQAFTTGFNL